MVSVVNGFVCRSSCDEAVARKGRDPQNPNDDPVKAERLALRRGEPAEQGWRAAADPDVRAVAFERDESTVPDGPSRAGTQLYAPGALLNAIA